MTFGARGLAPARHASKLTDMSTLRFGCLALALGVLSSGSCTNPTAAGPVASWIVTPNHVNLIRGDSVTLSVTPLDADGHLVTGAIPVIFESSEIGRAHV